jgi:hypothetical protein
MYAFCNLSIELGVFFWWFWSENKDIMFFSGSVGR